MAMNVPTPPKVYTTKYENFRGVDFTNDPTNVWRRRSPSAVNMLPDASGKPFKRHGWEVLISNEELCTALSVTSCQIEKCAYFELAGVDHIVVFTSEGVVFYANGDVMAISTEYDCYTGYDRSFFFEGEGIAAFYIYGDFNVWRYSYDNGFVFEDVTDKITVPTVLISANANCIGTIYEGYNLLGTKAAVEYNDVQLFEYWCSDGITIKVDKDAFISGKTVGVPCIYEWKWNGSSWAIISGGLTFPSSQIEVLGTPKTNDEIFVIYAYGVMLPNNVTQDQVGDMKAWASKKAQFDFELEVVDESSSAMWAVLHTDPLEHEGARAWLEFFDNWQELVEGEDFIRVEFPSVSVKVTPIENKQITGTASLVGA